jgi:hypothetical protein
MPGYQSYSQKVLERVLTNKTSKPITLKEFNEFTLKVTHDNENLEFLREVEELRKLENNSNLKTGASLQIAESKTSLTKPDLEQFCLYLAKKYINQDAEFELNLPETIRNEILIHFNQLEYTSNVFKDAQTHVLQLVYDGSFKRFIEKTLQTNMMKKGYLYRSLSSILTGSASIALISIAFLNNWPRLQRLWAFPLVLMFCVQFSLIVWRICPQLGLLGRVELDPKSLAMTCIGDTCLRQDYKNRTIKMLSSAFLEAIVIILIITLI